MEITEEIQELLSAWEETYKKGQLTFWIFLSLKEGRKYVSEIKDFVLEKSCGTISCEEQSLYRALRKYEIIGVLNYELGGGNKGPDRKYYFLTPLGEKLFEKFSERNIKIFYSPEIKSLLNF